MLRHTLGFALAIVTIGLGVSCSSESTEPSATGGASGSGGSGGSGGGGSGGDGGSGGEGGVPCGNLRCTSMAGVTGEPCCIDQFTSICGFRMGSQCAPPPAVADPRCPSVSVPVIGMLASCCTMNGDCGVVAPRGFGSGGCTELGEAQRQANEISGRFDGGIGFDAGFMFDGGGFNIMFPPPKRCDQ